MEEKYYYVYEWYNIDTNEVFYVGKGCRNRSNQTTNRNQIFKEYYANHNCAVRRIEYFDNEEEALQKEHERIMFYKSQGQAIANLDDGGKGGLSIVWTQEMRDYKSKYNPMKDKAQRQRMSEENPMKNPEIAKKVGRLNMRPVIINGQEYEGVIIAAKTLDVSQNTIIQWCQRGYDTDGNPCRYKDEEQKEIPFIKTLGRNVTNIKGVIIDGQFYPTVKSGAQTIDVWPETLIRAIKGNRKCKGHTCSYANQQPSQENNQ